MEFAEYTHLAKAAFIDFRRNKVRTFLTALGIMIGVLSVVMLIALGLGLKNYLAEQFEGLGANLVMVMPGSGFGGEGGGFSGPAGLFGGVEFDEKEDEILKTGWPNEINDQEKQDFCGAWKRYFDYSKLEIEEMCEICKVKNQKNK